MKAWHFNIFFCLALLGAFSPAFAAETLRFSEPVPRSSLEKIKPYIFNSLNKDIQDFEIGKTDLNSDGLDEFIARSKQCETPARCEFHILAESDDAVLPLGSFEGKSIALGNEFRHGVRNLLVFHNEANDFDYHLYTWHPELSAYRKSGP